MNRGGRGGGFGRGGGRGFGGRGGGGRGGFGRGAPMGPPERVIAVGEFLHTCKNDIVCKTVQENVPKTRRVFFENKQEIGMIDEILGPTSGFLFSIKLNEGVKGSAFKPGQQVYMDPQDLLNIDIFTKPRGRMPQKGPHGVGRGFPQRGGGGGRGGGRGGFGGGRGGFGGGRGGGGFRGGNRGGGGGGFRGGRGGGGGGFRGGR